MPTTLHAIEGKREEREEGREGKNYLTCPEFIVLPFSFVSAIRACARTWVFTSCRSNGIRKSEYISNIVKKH